jgi:hypothetical protein
MMDVMELVTIELEIIKKNPVNKMMVAMTMMIAVKKNQEKKMVVMEY